MDCILPKELEIRLENQFGSDFILFKQSLKRPAPVSVRINTRKIAFPPEINSGVAWEPNGFYLKKRPQFTLDPLFHGGAYYVQEASSMFTGFLLKQIIDPDESIRVLDLCGAPGGKSTQIASILNDKSLLVSNEVIRSRSFILAENLIKWGKPNVVVTQNDPKDFQKLFHFFDVLVIDAPCSGEGLFRRDAAAVEEWSVENARLCSLRQQRIVADSWDALKPGGFLIYSTCTFNPGENEQNLEWIMQQFDAECISVQIPENWGVESFRQGHISGFRFLPYKINGEGFFISVIRKKEIGEGNRKPVQLKTQPLKIEKVLLKELSGMLTHTEEFGFLSSAAKIVAIPVSQWTEFMALSQRLNVIHAGIPMIEPKGKKMIPLHELALSVYLKQEAFPAIELNEYQALQYLHRDAVHIPGQNPGIKLVTYHGITLGWMNNLGTRSNNNYPQNWRIRMDLPVLNEFESQNFL